MEITRESGSTESFGASVYVNFGATRSIANVDKGTNLSVAHRLTCELAPNGECSAETPWSPPAQRQSWSDATDLPAHSVGECANARWGNVHYSQTRLREWHCCVTTTHHDFKHFFLILGRVLGDKLDDGALAPLGKVFDAREKMKNDQLVNRHATFGAQNLIQRDQCIGHDLCVLIAQHIVKDVDQIRVFDGLRNKSKQFGATHDGRFAHVRRRIDEALAQRAHDVLDDVGESARAANSW